LVTVVVAARDEAATIARCVRSLREQTHRAVEIVVVDDGSRDATGTLAAAAGATVLVGEARGLGAARNLGTAVARGTIVAFLDADSYAARDWLTRLVEALADPPLVGVGGVQLAPDDATEFQRRLQRFFECVGFVSDYVRSSSGTVRETSHNPGGNSAYRREVLVSADGLREDMFACEDLELDRRLTLAGRRLGFVPDARMYHYRVCDLAGFRRMMRRYGAGHRQLVALHGRFRLLHWLPIAVPAGAVSLGVMFCVWPTIGEAVATGALAAMLSVLALRSRPLHLASNVHLLAEALIAWLRGYYYDARMTRNDAAHTRCSAPEYQCGGLPRPGDIRS
jgi:cellulose synthase/poly-beta-1,6-N-acetylglucosamine synthase-like glycosyltransferase